MGEQLEIKQDIVTPLLAWYDDHKRILPWREDQNPYRVWVSEIMLQQTRVEAVKPYFDRFMQALPSVKELAQAKEERLLKLWEGLGYYNRARNLQKAACLIVEEYGGSFPQSYEELLKLPGIGEYTAGAIASISFGERVPAVDGNVLRIISRLMLYEEDIVSQRAKREVRAALMPLMPAKRSGDFNQALMELGATVCIPNGDPACGHCPWKGMCRAQKEKLYALYPKKSPKKQRKTERKTVLIIGDGDRVLLHKRDERGLLAGLYELPSLAGWAAEAEVIDAVRSMGFSPLRIRRLEAAKHVFTHKEWHMQGFCILVEPLEFAGGGQKELPKDCVLSTRKQSEEEYPIPSAFAVYTRYLDIHPGMGKKIR